MFYLCENLQQMTTEKPAKKARKYMPQIARYFEYRGVQYPAREICIKDECLLISTTDLSAALFPNDNYNYETAEIRYIDEAIFFFVEHNELMTMTKKQLTEFVNGNAF